MTGILAIVMIVDRQTVVFDTSYSIPLVRGDRHIVPLNLNLIRAMLAGYCLKLYSFHRSLLKGFVNSLNLFRCFHLCEKF